MNCSACGMQLPQGAANCPQCGATTPYFYASTAPNDTTVVSPLYTDAQPYQNPYDVAPFAPPPPSPKRRANRISIIVGVVLLVLLLIGGGFAWLAYSSARNAAAAAAAATTTAHTNATASATVQHLTAKGTGTIVSSTTTSVRQDGQNKINSITQQVVSYGDITGSFTNEETSIVHPDNTASFSGSSTCICTVNGKSGTLMWSFNGTSTANDSFQGQFFDIHGTGDLAKLHGQGVYQGQGLHDTYSSDLYFDS
jgi:ketosteroid isomerase-like protein